MRYLKSGLMLLSAALMSSSCEQSTAERFNNALAVAKAKMTDSSESRELAMTCPVQPDHSDELLRLKQQLQQVQQQLLQSNAALVAAKSELNGHSPSLQPAAAQPVAAVTQTQTNLAMERRITTATSKHVNQLERRLSDQDLQLSKLHKSLLATEAGCREIADELASKATPS